MIFFFRFPTATRACPGVFAKFISFSSVNKSCHFAGCFLFFDKFRFEVGEFVFFFLCFGVSKFSYGELQPLGTAFVGCLLRAD